MGQHVINNNSDHQLIAGVGCMITVKMLGSFQLEVNGQPIPVKNWKSRKALTLFKYLAHCPGKKVPRDSIIDLLWADSDITCATHNFHTTLYNLRRSLFPGGWRSGEYKGINHANGLYWFAPEQGYYVDLADFKNKVRQSIELEERNPEASLQLCLEAYQLYRGDFLEEDLYEEWTTITRENLREMYLDLAVRTAELLVSCRKDYQSAVKVCRQALEFDQSREKLHCLIIRCLIAVGHHADAVIQYKACEKAMQEELAISPSSETRQLVMGLSEGERSQTLPRDSNSLSTILKLGQIRSEQEGQPYTLIMVTLPREGKSLLERALELLQKTLRGGDLACRWSDRQIIILLPTTDHRGAEVVAARLKKMLEAYIPASTLSFRVLDPGEPQAAQPLEIRAKALANKMY